MKHIHYKTIAFGLLFCSVLSCSLANRIKKEVDRSQSPQVLNSTDNISQITVPGSWKKRTDLHEEAVIQAGNPFAEQYMVIIRDDRTDFGKNFTLDTITEIARDNFTKAATETSLTDPIPVTINGYSAKQFETSGEVENIKIKYLYAIVETPNSFYQILTWTLNSKFDENKSTFLEVINSFKEIGDGNSVPPPPKSESNSKN
ncbi:hypothetical protein BH20ACI1_BH20ACI1_24640 [soil metagenome]